MNKRMYLTKAQEQIMMGHICPYCKQTTKLVDSSIIYGTSYGYIYLCQPCDAYVGLHKHSSRSLGRCANKELRDAKIETHSYFDKVWKESSISRNRAYVLLARHLNLPIEYCHIGFFSLSTCKKVVIWAQEMVKNKRKNRRRKSNNK